MLENDRFRNVHTELLQFSTIKAAYNNVTLSTITHSMLCVLISKTTTLWWTREAQGVLRRHRYEKKLRRQRESEESEWENEEEEEEEESSEAQHW